MNLNKTQYLQAMGIQAWQLKSNTNTLMILLEKNLEEHSAAKILLKAMIDVVDLNNMAIHVVYCADSPPEQQISRIKPKVIWVLGQQIAAQLLHTAPSNIALITTDDPNHLLQHPQDKKKAYLSLQLLQQLLST